MGFARAVGQVLICQLSASIHRDTLKRYRGRERSLASAAAHLRKMFSPGSVVAWRAIMVSHLDARLNHQRLSLAEAVRLAIF